MYLDEMCWFFVSSFFFFFKFSLMILANNLCNHLLSVDFCLLRPQVFFTKSWKQQEHFIPLLNFYELILYTLYIYYMWKKNWNKGCIFYFFKFSRMLCWKNYEIFSWRIMMNIMPIITDLLKKMGYFFKPMWMYITFIITLWSKGEIF